MMGKVQSERSSDPDDHLRRSMRLRRSRLLARAARLGLLAGTLLAGACQRPVPAAARRGVQIVPAGGGAVDTVVRSALADARREQRRLLVYVSATWCQPCERFQAAVRAGTLDGTFPDLRLLVFDHDHDGARLAAAGYDGRLIPRFVVPGPDGRATARRMEGGTRAQDTVSTFIAPRLAQLLGPAPSPP
jgi:hypothetical protein